MVDRATPARKVSLVVYVDAGNRLNEAAKISDAKVRAQRVDTIYRQAKRPVVEKLSGYLSAGLRIVTDLEGTPGMVVVGPAKTWRKVIQEQPDLMENPRWRMVPNDPEFAGV
ncbi:hypothetical protein E2493_02480 [Sphingomonas parva]|uniref:Uncharacterized protein n=1 Tax=Sphingomonas parva TaxID=2555898 RepID=A0A4Y8ZUP1_9SPHN|nr:hypothetical protein [Sphingomonas parva]TFI59731.1 hypothetical protein E2493_02480 [Sphingomonas parva]